jgi:hypothetical protein
MQITFRTVAAAFVIAAAPTALVLPVWAQSQGLTFDQVQRKYRGMNEVHIAKCDYNRDNLIEPKEIHCIQGIYQVMYLDRD